MLTVNISVMYIYHLTSIITIEFSATSLNDILYRYSVLTVWMILSFVFGILQFYYVYLVVNFFLLSYLGFIVFMEFINSDISQVSSFYNIHPILSNITSMRYLNFNLLVCLLISLLYF